MGLKPPPEPPPLPGCPECCELRTWISLEVSIPDIGDFHFDCMQSPTQHCNYGGQTNDPYPAYGSVRFCMEIGAKSMFIEVPGWGWTESCGVWIMDCLGFSCVGPWGSSFSCG